MNIENVIHNENLTLKPLPPKILYCSVCKTDFISHLKLNAEFYKTCDECRNKVFASFKPPTGREQARHVRRGKGQIGRAHV